MVDEMQNEAVTHKSESSLRDRIKAGIAETMERLPGVSTIAVPWGSGEDVNSEAWEVFKSILETDCAEFKVKFIICKWGGGNEPSSGGLVAVGARRPPVSFAGTDSIINYELHSYYYTTVNAKGKVTEYPRKFTRLPGYADVGRGGMRKIIAEGGIKGKLRIDPKKSTTCITSVVKRRPLGQPLIYTASWPVTPCIHREFSKRC